MNELPSLEEIAAAEANHDPRTCGDSTCAAVPEGSEWFMMGMSVAPDGRVTFHHEAESRLHLRVYRTHAWAELCAQYTADPDDFVTAHQWLEKHPIFHRFDTPTTQTALPEDPDGRRAAIAELEENEGRLIDDQGLQDATLTVFRGTEPDEHGPAGPRVLIEHGPHLWASDQVTDPHVGAGGCSSHDPDVDAIGATYEQAIVAVAKNVFTHYGCDRSKIRRH